MTQTDPVTEGSTALALSVSDIQVVNNVETITHLKLAESLGYVLTDNAKHFLSSVERLSETDPGFQELGELSVGTESSIGKSGPKAKLIHFTEEQALYITAKSNKPEAARLTLAMVKVFSAYRAGTLQMTTPFQVRGLFADLAELYQEAARLPDKLQRSFIATGKAKLRLVSSQSSVPVTAPTGQLSALPAPSDQYLKVTTLGKACTPQLSAQDLNKTLEALGLQDKYSGVWVLTDEGKKYGKALPEDPYQQVIWSARVLELIK